MTHAFSHRLNGLAAALLFSLGTSCPVSAETMDCTPITVLPATITEQGIYCLTDNLNTALSFGDSIDIQTNNVTIDLNGWKLGGLAGGPGTVATGIHALERKNITVRNGTVRGFFRGIWLEGSSSQGNLVEDIRAEQNRVVGIWTQGRGDIIRRNQVIDTGNTTGNVGLGIRVEGDGARVVDNDIVGVVATSTSTAIGIEQTLGVGVVIAGNRVAEIENVDSANAIGIFLSSSSNGIVAGNHIAGPLDSGVQFQGATGGYRDNTVFGATTAFSGGTDLSGNESGP